MMPSLLPLLSSMEQMDRQLSGEVVSPDTVRMRQYLAARMTEIKVEIAKEPVRIMSAEQSTTPK